MKALIAALAITCLAAPVHADNGKEVFAKANNTLGGEIVLLATRGNCSSTELSMFSYDGTGNVIKGCWKIVAGYPSVRFSDGERRLYPDKGWDINPFYEKKQPAWQ